MWKVEGEKMNGRGCKPVAWGSGEGSKLGWTLVLCGTSGSWASVLLRKKKSLFSFFPCSSLTRPTSTTFCTAWPC